MRGAVTDSHQGGVRQGEWIHWIWQHHPPVTNSHATPLAGVKDIQKALRPRIERELCAVGGTLRRKVEAEYQSELVEKYRELKRRHQTQRQQLDRALRGLDDADPPRKRARR